MPYHVVTHNPPDLSKSLSKNGRNTRPLGAGQVRKLNIKLNLQIAPCAFLLVRHSFSRNNLYKVWHHEGLLYAQDAVIQGADSRGHSADGLFQSDRTLHKELLELVLS